MKEETTRLLQSLVYDDEEEFAELIRISRKYIKIDKVGGVIFLTSPTKRDTYQTVTLVLLSRYFAAELGLGGATMTIEEIQVVTGLKNAKVKFAINRLKSQGIVDAIGYNKIAQSGFRINWQKARIILAELEDGEIPERDDV